MKATPDQARRAIGGGQSRLARHRPGTPSPGFETIAPAIPAHFRGDPRRRARPDDGPRLEKVRCLGGT
jgi:hypothetical protein